MCAQSKSIVLSCFMFIGYNRLIDISAYRLRNHTEKAHSCHPHVGGAGTMETSSLCAAGLIYGVLLLLLLLLKYGFRTHNQSKGVRVPGLERTHPELGNLEDISTAGSVYEFLTTLHGKYGGIASFWWGKQWAVSISTPELFKQHARLFDRPRELYTLFEPMFTSEAITYANGPEGQHRHTAYSRCFSEAAMNNYCPAMQANTKGILHKLRSLSQDEHVPLKEYMFAFANKTVLQAVYGKRFEDDDAILRLEHSHGVVWHDLESRLHGDLPAEGTERLQRFQRECGNIRSTMEAVLQDAKQNPSHDPSKSNFLDVVSKLDISEAERTSDMVAVFVSTFHTTALLLTWALYYLASHPEVQQKAANEVAALDELPSGPEAISKLVYLRQVLDETLRCSSLAPYAARYSDDDYQLGGYTIPAGTPVIQALGVSFQDPSRWPEPQQFDPERFSPENRKTIPAFGFEPFGFAGKRKCPGYRFAVSEASILFAGILREFEVSLVPGQQVVPTYGLVTAPTQEIWLTFKRRE
jgi:cytochrome P450 family 20 subfamily A